MSDETAAERDRLREINAELLAIITLAVENDWFDDEAAKRLIAKSRARAETFHDD